jgi:hypothetical protein
MALDTHLGFTIPELVTTLLGGQNGLVFAFAPVYEAGNLKLIRASLFCQCFSVANGVMDVSVGYQLSDDGVNWPTSTTTPMFFTANVNRQQEGPAIGNFEDLSSALTKKYVRFVVWVKNTPGNTGLGTCLAAIRIERRSC